MNLKKFFIDHCNNNKYEINQNQLHIIKHLKNYYTENFQQTFLSKILKKNKNKLGFYLVGDVGVGKTMILNFFFNILKEKKLRLHFNEFMITFHDFIFDNKNKDNAIDLFVKDLKINKPWFLSGGINIDNIKVIKREIQPFGIDLSSGVEKELGIKDNHIINNLMGKLINA